MTGHQPLPMPALTRREATDARLRHAHRAALGLGPSLQFRLCEPDGGACGPEPVRIALRWGEHDIALRCPAELVRDALLALDPELAPLAALPPDLAGLLLEAAGADIIQQWERASGQSVAVREVMHDDAPTPDGLAMALHGGAMRCRMHLECTPSQAAAILASWPVAPRPMDRLVLPAVIRLGATTLLGGVVASLRPGDAVLLQRHAAPGMLVVAGWVAALRRTDDGWTLAEAPRPGPDDEGGWTMADQQANVLAAANPDDIPVTLTFEVGHLDMALGELRRLGPGSVIELGRSRHELVEIAAHGRTVGQGELVEIEGAVGVRIVRLFDCG